MLRRTETNWVLRGGGCQKPAVLPWDVWVCPTSELSMWGRIWMRILGKIYGPSTKLRFIWEDASSSYEVVAYPHTSTPHVCPSLLLVLDKEKHKKEELEAELWNSGIEKRGAGKDLTGPIKECERCSSWSPIWRGDFHPVLWKWRWLMYEEPSQ